MPFNNQVLVYLEDPPVGADVVATGLSRAASPILRSISPWIDRILVFPSGRRFDESDLDRDLAMLCSTAPTWLTTIWKALRRLPKIEPGVCSELVSRLLARWATKSPAETVFAMVGADYTMLVRTRRLARLAGKSYALYLVDDFISALSLSGASLRRVQKASREAASVLQGAGHVFTITEGLGELLGARYGVATTTLQLAFEPKPRADVAVKNQVIFVGNINFLYLEGLRALMRTIECIRRGSQSDLRLRLTLPPEIAARSLGELPAFVISEPLLNSQDLSAEIASSLFAFLPYSFETPQRIMVSTSFPSKSMEYLAYARSIVVYGPEYGVATKLFAGRGLPTIVSSEGELRVVTEAQLRERPDHSISYRSYLEEVHSNHAVRATLCTTLGLEITGA